MYFWPAPARPVRKVLVDINEEAAKHPECIAEDPYAAWLLRFRGEPEHSLDVYAYHEFLEEGWAETERLLKGQM